MKHFSRHILWIATLTCSIALSGCGGAVEKPIVPVAGKVAFANGKKLPVGTRLVFEPTEGRVGTAVGTVADDGSFQTTHVSGAAGAEEGKYTVKLLPPEAGSTEFNKLVSKQCQEDAFAFAEVKVGMAPLDFKVPAMR
jgi:hypothetical protein